MSVHMIVRDAGGGTKHLRVFGEGSGKALVAKRGSQSIHQRLSLPGASIIRPNYLCVFVGQFERFEVQFKGRPLEVSTGAMSTVIVGELAETFEAITAAFASAADRGPAVLVVKVSNACPLGNAPE